VLTVFNTPQVTGSIPVVEILLASRGWRFLCVVRCGETSSKVRGSSVCAETHSHTSFWRPHSHCCVCVSSATVVGSLGGGGWSRVSLRRRLTAPSLGRPGDTGLASQHGYRSRVAKCAVSSRHTRRRACRLCAGEGARSRRDRGGTTQWSAKAQHGGPCRASPPQPSTAACTAPWAAAVVALKAPPLATRGRSSARAGGGCGWAQLGWVGEGRGRARRGGGGSGLEGRTTRI
jgi:hypothetical protein